MIHGHCAIESVEACRWFEQLAIIVLFVRAASENLNASERVAGVSESSWSSFIFFLVPMFSSSAFSANDMSWKLKVTSSNPTTLIKYFQPDEALLTGNKHPCDKRE